MKTSAPISLAEAAKRLRKLADELERGRLSSPEGTLRLPKGTKATIDVASSEAEGNRAVDVGLGISYAEPGKAAKARQAVTGRSKGEWAKSGADLLVLLPAVLSTVGYVRARRSKGGN